MNMATLDVKQYIEQLAQAAGLSDEEKAGILKVASNDKFAKSLSDDILRQQDYSRNMDAIKAQEKKNADYYAQLVAWEQQEQARIAAALAGNGGQVVNGEYITKKELDELDNRYKKQALQQEQSFITIAKEMGRLSSQHAVEFREALDVDALEKIAIEKQLPLRQAYTEMVAARRAEASTASRQAEIEKAKQDAVREYASTHHIPLDTTPRESEYGRLTFDKAPDKSAVPDYQPNTGRLSPQGERTLREGFVESWNKAGAAPQAT
jgi:hypothetical protein